MTFSPQLLCFKHGIEWLESFCLFSSGHKIRYKALGQLLPCAYLATRRECYLSGTPWWFPEGMPQVFLIPLYFHTIIDLGDLERPHSIKQQRFFFFLSATTIFMRILIKNNTTFCHHRLGLLIFDGSRQPTVPEPHWSQTQRHLVLCSPTHMLSKRNPSSPKAHSSRRSSSHRNLVFQACFLMKG